ncbi:unnamed protein product, partial [marine sediment metagenome]
LTVAGTNQGTKRTQRSAVVKEYEKGWQEEKV